DAQSVSKESFKTLPYLPIIEIHTGEDRKHFLIRFQKTLAPGSFELFPGNIRDCQGTLADSTISYSLFIPSPPPAPPARIDTAQLIITEIFADPSPEVGLPLVEFIEIFN